MEFKIAMTNILKKIEENFTRDQGKILPGNQ